MAEPIGGLRIELSASNAKLLQDLGKARGNIRTFTSGASKDVGGLITQFRGLASTFAAVFVTGAIGRSINNVAQLGDELSKLSQKTGLSVEFLNGLTQAGNLAGVSNEQLSVGLRQLSKNLLDTTRGTGEAKESFEAMGIRAKEAADLLKTPDQAFLTIAQRLANIPDTSRRAAEAMRIFGRSGAELLPFLNQGADAMAKQIAQMQKLRPITTEQAKAAEAYNDALETLKFAFEGLAIAATTNLIPALTKLVDTLTALFSLDAETFQRNMRAILGGDFTDADRIASLKEQRALIVSTIQEMEKSLAEGGGKTFFGLLDSGLESGLKRARAQLAQVDADLKALTKPKEAKFQPEVSPEKTVTEKSLSKELQGQLALREAQLKLAEAEDKRDQTKRDRTFNLKGEIILLKEQLAIQKEIEDAAKPGKEREVDPSVIEAAAVERLAAMVSLSEERRQNQEAINAAMQVELGLDAQSTASQQLILKTRDLTRIAQKEEFNLQLRQLDTLGNEELLRGQQVITLKAQINAEKNLAEVMGETEERVQKIAVLEARLANIRKDSADEARRREEERQRQAGEVIVEQSKRDLEARLEPFRRAVRDAQKQVDFGERAPGQLPETNRLRRIELIQKTIDLLEEERRVGLISTEEFNRGFILADADLRRETYESQRGFFEGWQDAFKQFSGDASGAFGLGQTLARQFTTNVQTLSSSIFSNVFDKLTDGTLTWKSALETVPNILKQIAAQLIGLTIAQGVASAIGGGFGGLFGNTTSGPFASLRGQPGFGFAGGGQFVVGGAGGRDANFVPLKLTRGELIDIKTPQQQRDQGSGIQVNVFNNAGETVDVRPAADGRSLDIYVDRRTEKNVAGGRANKLIASQFGLPRRGRVG